MDAIIDKISDNIKTVVLLSELFLCLLIIRFIPYTEIDWVAYMQQVEIFLNGERDYMKIEGQTGPLVYPAGHVYCFSLFYYLTGHGQNILIAQFIFMGIYLLQMYYLLKVYEQALIFKDNYWWIVILLMISRRVHSIYMLRCFNDGIAMLFLYIGVYHLQQSKNRASLLYFSIALSVKMNILLFVPGIYLILSRSVGLFKGTLYLLIMPLAQVVIGLPFILHNADSYFKKAFEFDRQFLFKWSVNWNYLGERVATSREFALILLGLHLLFLLIFLFSKWIEFSRIFRELSISPLQFFPSKRDLNPEYVTLVLFTCNFIGICFARSLHYQFYSWYFHTLPFLLMSCDAYYDFIKVGLLFGIELCWNLFPPSFKCSLGLTIIHGLVLLGLLLRYRDNIIYLANNKKLKEL